MVLAARAGVVVDGSGPRAGVPGVGGEVADGVPELAVNRPPEAVGDAGTGPAGDRRDPGQPGQRFGVGEAGPAVADLGEQPGGTHCAGPGQRGEDVPVGVGGQLPGDLGFQGLDLGGQRGQRGGQGGGDARLGGAVCAGGAGRRGVQPRVQFAGRGRAAAHRDGRQPRADGLLVQLRGGVLAAEPGQERQADRAVQVVEQPEPRGERHGQVRAQLVAGRHPVRHQVPACAHRHPQRDCRGRIGDQRPQPGPVRAQRIRQHERVEPVVFGAGGAEPGPKVLHLPGGDHYHGDARGEQRIDERPVASLDGDLGDLVLAQPGNDRGDPGLVVRGGEPVDDPAGHVDHAHGVISGGPVDPGAHAASRDIGQNLG